MAKVVTIFKLCDSKTMKFPWLRCFSLVPIYFYAFASLRILRYYDLFVGEDLHGSSSSLASFNEHGSIWRYGFGVRSSVVNTENSDKNYIMLFIDSDAGVMII